MHVFPAATRTKTGTTEATKEHKGVFLRVPLCPLWLMGLCPGPATVDVTNVLLPHPCFPATIAACENSSGWWFRGKTPGQIKFEPTNRPRLFPRPVYFSASSFYIWPSSADGP